ncbi:hypothetical protein K458DRAFT_492800 [Lentithecium fluviatile CBS 122367]|uniref:Uncharacterized protein n=1 Tax=Lentithecium fluviatile CBS 122367 TaxID=1168545 RepID=A0A6G1ICR0_9PLEO|nr:hypothetical protein K458DRAFT_492800 [Lentithecium fluviatile CBS 122367]
MLNNEKGTNGAHRTTYSALHKLRIPAGYATSMTLRIVRHRNRKVARSFRLNPGRNLPKFVWQVKVQSFRTDLTLARFSNRVSEPVPVSEEDILEACLNQAEAMKYLQGAVQHLQEEFPGPEYEMEYQNGAPSVLLKQRARTGEWMAQRYIEARCVDAAQFVRKPEEQVEDEA